MAILEPNQSFCADLCEAMGLPKYTKSFKIIADEDCFVVVECSFILDKEQDEKIKTLLKKYTITVEEIK